MLPQVSAFALAAARLGWSHSDTDCLTLHGRPLDLLNASVFPGARLLMLTDDGAAPALIARPTGFTEEPFYQDDDPAIQSAPKVAFARPAA